MVQGSLGRQWRLTMYQTFPLMPGLRQHHSKWKVPIKYGAEQNAYIETKTNGDFERNEE
ncbi:hypothetical protein Plhal710r2_c033g0122041 [Plasmopara halstedii]